MEHQDKVFGERNRFYNMFENQKKHGVKYIPPPVAETVQQLLDDEELHNLK